MNHIHSTCFKQWHSVISSITGNEGDPRDHPEGIVQKEYPPVAKIKWKNFHSIGKSILTTWSGTRILDTSHISWDGEGNNGRPHCLGQKPTVAQDPLGYSARIM